MGSLFSSPKKPETLNIGRRAGSEYEIARSVAGARRILQRWGALPHTEGQAA